MTESSRIEMEIDARGDVCWLSGDGPFTLECITSPDCDRHDVWRLSSGGKRFRLVASGDYGYGGELDVEEER